MPYVTARPAIVYGVSDLTGLMPRLCCGATYTKLNETMKFLWSKSLRINCIHVTDVVRGLVLLSTQNTPHGAIYNMVDETDLDQGKLNTHLESLFGIKTGFQGTVFSTMASKLSMTNVAT